MPGNTIPVESALEEVRSGKNLDDRWGRSTQEECFVMAEEGADKAKIEKN